MPRVRTPCFEEFMNTLEKLLRESVDGLRHDEKARLTLDVGDCAELLQEIDRLRAESAGVREACARICDERAKSAAEGIDDLDDVGPEVYARLRTRSDEAEDCAAAIRAMGAP